MWQNEVRGVASYPACSGQSLPQRSLVQPWTDLSSMVAEKPCSALNTYNDNRSHDQFTLFLKKQELIQSNGFANVVPFKSNILRHKLLNKSKCKWSWGVSMDPSPPPRTFLVRRQIQSNYSATSAIASPNPTLHQILVALLMFLLYMCYLLLLSFACLPSNTNPVTWQLWKGSVNSWVRITKSMKRDFEI